MEQNNASHNQIITIPMAIVLAAVIISGTLLYMYRPTSNSGTSNAAASGNVAPSAAVPDINNLPPVTAADHILGNPNAPIKIVEYSDPSCPYCKMFQTTMLQIMQDYGASGQVAWIYRQFPLDKPDANGNILHKNAGAQANAFECAASIGGNAGFWAFEKDWFSAFPLDGADETAAADNQRLVSVAKDVGLDAKAFNDCLSSNKFSGAIDKQYKGGLSLGIDGTPSSYIITPKGAPIAFQGAQPYATLKSAIDAILADLAASSSTANQ